MHVRTYRNACQSPQSLAFKPLLLLHHHLDTIILVYFNTRASHSNAYRPYPASSSPSSFDWLSTSWLFVLTSLRLPMACATMSTPSWRLLGSLNSALPAAKFQAKPHPAFCPSTTLVCMEFLHERLDAFQGTHHPPVVRASGDKYSHHLHDDFQQSPASRLFQLPQSRGSFLECFHSSSGQPWCFRQLHPAASLSIHLTVAVHGSYSPLIWHQLVHGLLPFQLLGRFTSTPCCASSLASFLNLQISIVASTVGNGLCKSALCRLPLGNETCSATLLFTSLSSDRRDKTCLCNPWSSWSFRMSFAEAKARECWILSYVSAVS